MTFWICHHANSSLLIVTNSRGYGNSSNLEWTKKLFIEKYVISWHFERVTSIRIFLRSPTRVVMAIVPIWNHQKNFLFQKYVFPWHFERVTMHLVTSFVTNTRSYGHSSNLEWTKKLFIEKYVISWHFERVTSLRHFFRHKHTWLWP